MYVKRIIHVVAINVINERINGNIPFVPSQRRACSNVPGTLIKLDDPKTIMSIMILAMSHAISHPSAFIAIS